MKEISLTQGRVALVDDIDFVWLSEIPWSACKRSEKHCWYTVTNIRRPDGSRSTTSMHRMIMQPGLHEVVDHIDGDGLNNQRSNLRVCTQSQNVCNATGHRRSTSAYKGVSRAKGKKRPWLAQIQAAKEHYWLGTYATEREAAEAYNKAAILHFGEFAKLNIFDEPAE